MSVPTHQVPQPVLRASVHLAIFDRAVRDSGALGATRRTLAPLRRTAAQPGRRQSRRCAELASWAAAATRRGVFLVLPGLHPASTIFRHLDDFESRARVGGRPNHHLEYYDSYRQLVAGLGALWHRGGRETGTRLNYQTFILFNKVNLSVPLLVHLRSTSVQTKYSKNFTDWRRSFSSFATALDIASQIPRRFITLTNRA